MKNILDEQLLIAIRQGDIQKSDKLLSAGSDIHGVDKNGYTCLDWAIAFGNDEMIEMLIKKGADDSDERIAGFMTCQSAFNDKLFGSLIYSFSQGSVKIAEELIRSGVSTKGKTEKEDILLSDVITKACLDGKMDKKDLETIGKLPGMRKYLIRAYMALRMKSKKNLQKATGKKAATAGKPKKKTLRQIKGKKTLQKTKGKKTFQKAKSKKKK